MRRLQKCLVGAQDLQLENTVVRGDYMRWNPATLKEQEVWSQTRWSPDFISFLQISPKLSLRNNENLLAGGF